MSISSQFVADTLREKMSNGKVNFVFMKKDGSRRPAVGTLSQELIPFELMPTGNVSAEESREKQNEQGIVKYFDCDKMAWRSCKVENILEIEGEEVQQ